MGVLNKKMNLVEAVIGKRLKGEKDTDEPLFLDSDIEDLFSALRESARERRAGVSA
jgi:hypothetical protein